jgi:hypothetical protein
MTITKARNVLVAIFLASLVIQIGAVILTYTEGAIASKDLSTLLLKLLAVYSVHLAVIFGGIFAQQQDGQPVQTPTTAFWVAVVVAAIWNVLLIWRSIAFCAAAFNINLNDNVLSLSTYIDDVSKAGSFLVAGALAFFFTKR